MPHSDDRTSSAASMIRRFREGKPTSKLEREAARGANDTRDKEMWWVEKESRTRTFETDEFEQPRPAPKAALKQTRSHSEILEKLRQPTDYMSMTANKQFSADRSVNVDEMIEREIRGLEREMNVQTRRSGSQRDKTMDTSYNFNEYNQNRLSTGSLHPSEYEPTYRYNGGNGDGNGFSEIRTRAGKATFSDREMNTGDKGRGSSSSGSRDPARHDDDFFRSSLDTLGSTGFRGLLDQSLRLGGKKDFFPANLKAKSSDATKSGNITEINASLEELLKSLNDGDKLIKIDDKNINQNIIENENKNENQSILQITKKLEYDMTDFQSYFNAKYSEEDDIIKKQKERDILMKAEGRNEILKKQLNRINFSENYSKSFLGEYNDFNQSNENRRKYGGDDDDEAREVLGRNKKEYRNNDNYYDYNDIDINRNHHSQQYYYQHCKSTDDYDDNDDNDHNSGPNYNRENDYHGHGEQKNEKQKKISFDLSEDIVNMREKGSLDVERNGNADGQEGIKSVREMVMVLENRTGNGGGNFLNDSVVEDDSDRDGEKRESNTEEQKMKKEMANRLEKKIDIIMVDKPEKKSDNNDQRNEDNYIADDENKIMRKSLESGQLDLIKELQQGLGDRIKQLDILHATVLGISDSKNIDPSSGPGSLVVSGVLGPRSTSIGGENSALSPNPILLNSTHTGVEDHETVYHGDDDDINHSDSGSRNNSGNRVNDNDNNERISNNYSLKINIRNIEELSSNRPLSQERQRVTGNDHGNRNGNRNGNKGQMVSYWRDGEEQREGRRSPHSIFNNNNNYNNSNNGSKYNKHDNDNNRNSNINDVQVHPYAGSSYVQSPCVELIHSNLLSVSQGISTLLDSTMNCLHIRLPDKNTKSNINNAEKNGINFENKKSNTKTERNFISEEERNSNELLKKEIAENDKGNKLINSINDANCVEKYEKLENASNKEIEKINNKIFEDADNRIKLEQIDKILGFDPEIDKKDFFSGQLKGLANDSKYFDKKKFQRNDDFQNLSIPNSTNKFSSNFTDNSKFPRGNYEPNSLLLEGDENKGKTMRRPPVHGARGEEDPRRELYGDSTYGTRGGNDVHRGHHNNSSDNNYIRNNNLYTHRKTDQLSSGNENTIISSSFSSTPSAPPIFPTSPSFSPSFFSFSSYPSPSSHHLPSSTTPPSHSDYERTRSDPFQPSSPHLNHFSSSAQHPYPSSLNSLSHPQSEERDYRKEQKEIKDGYQNSQYELISKKQKSALSRIELEIGSLTENKGFPSFSPSNYPAEGTAIRALRAAQKKEKDFIRSQRSSSGLDDLNTNDKIESKNKYSNNYLNNSSLGDGNKENNDLLNSNYVLPLPSAPASIRIEYLNNMKRMRQLAAYQ